MNGVNIERGRHGLRNQIEGLADYDMFVGASAEPRRSNARGSGSAGIPRISPQRRDLVNMRPWDILQFA